MEKNLFLVDDDLIIRDSLSWLFQSISLNVQVFDSVEKFLSAVEPIQIGCVILDICMPGKNGLVLQRILNQQCSTLEIVFLTGYADVPITSNVFKLGASDLLQKPVDPEILLQSIHRAWEKSCEKYMNYQEKRQFLYHFNQLTTREKQMLYYVLCGYSNKQIAAELFIALRTVEIHRHNMMQKMQCKNFIELSRILTIVALEELAILSAIKKSIN